MFRSTIRRLRRTLSFRSRSKHGGRKNAAGGGGNQNWEGDSANIKSAGCVAGICDNDIQYPGAAKMDGDIIMHKLLKEGAVKSCMKRAVIQESNSSRKQYLGCLEVSESRGTQVCSQAAHQMKMSSAGKKKQRVTLWVTEDTLRVIDDETKSLVVDQVIEKVSFCTPDPVDEKLFSYICRDGTSRRWLCHSFKGIKDTGERISHAVGCAFAACLAKKQAQNQQNQNFQRGNSTRKTLESRPNGVKLPAQSVETLAKLNQDEYKERVQKANMSMQSDASGAGANSEAEISVEQTSPTPKQPVSNNFARPRPSVGMDAASFTRHHSLPYRTKKSTGSSTYQALTEDPLPPRIPTTPDRLSPSNDDTFWLDNSNQNNITQPASGNPFTMQSQTVTIQQQAGVTQANMQVSGGQEANPFNRQNSGNPFNEKFV